MRTRLIVALLFMTASVPSLAEPIDIRIAPVGIHKSKEPIERIGRLVHIAGYDLNSDHDDFGGWSGFALSPDGLHFMAVSDGGFILKADIAESAPGKITAITNAAIEPLRDAEGKPFRGKSEEDAEGLIDLSGGALTGPFLVSFERDDRILRYDTFGGPGQLVFTPPSSIDIPNNDGMEAIVQLSDGRLFIATEKAKDKNGILIAFVWDQTAPPVQLALAKNGRHWPTDSATLPNGDVLILERDWNPLQGLSISLRLIPQDALVPGAPIKGTVLATLLGNVMHVDNMEGLAVRETKDGRTLVYMLSDDNFNPRGQRTLLQIFDLKD